MGFPLHLWGLHSLNATWGICGVVGSVWPCASSAMAARLEARLEHLPHAALLKLAANVCGETADGMRAAESALAAHKPFPEFFVDNVLLSPDLLAHVFVHFEHEDVASAAVCTAWHDAWVATGEQRRRLRHMNFDCAIQVSAPP